MLWKTRPRGNNLQVQGAKTDKLVCAGCRPSQHRRRALRCGAKRWQQKLMGCQKTPQQCICLPLQAHQAVHNHRFASCCCHCIASTPKEASLNGVKQSWAPKALTGNTAIAPCLCRVHHGCLSRMHRLVVGSASHAGVHARCIAVPCVSSSANRSMVCASKN